MSKRRATFAGLCILAICGIAVVLAFSEQSPRVSISILGFKAEQWPDDLVQQMGSREYIVATIELTNRSNKPIKYFGGSDGNHVFSGLWYETLGKWQAPTNTGFFCGSGIKEWTLAPTRSVVFDAMVDRDRPCKVAVSYSDDRVTSRISRRLPGWIAEKMPWARDWNIVTTEAIDLHGAPGLTAKPRESLSKLAQDGDVDAQFRLAGRYWSGNGVEKNPTEAIRWYETAALKGHTEAAYILGIIHEYGLAVNSDGERAKEWYRRASERGHAEAQLKLREYQTNQ